MQAASATMGANLALARYFFFAAAVVQLDHVDGSVLIWHMIDWISQWISGGRRSHGGGEARRKQREESQRPATRAIGVSRALACVLKHPWLPTGVLHCPGHPSCADA
jgi:hypothetical protein